MEELTGLLGRFIETLSPRTLLYVLGDHGFCMPSEGRSTGLATQGRASPEEVLVPGYAWLIGGMHESDTVVLSPDWRRVRRSKPDSAFCACLPGPTWCML